MSLAAQGKLTFWRDILGTLKSLIRKCFHSPLPPKQVSGTCALLWIPRGFRHVRSFHDSANPSKNSNGGVRRGLLAVLEQSSKLSSQEQAECHIPVRTPCNERSSCQENADSQLLRKPPRKPPFAIPKSSLGEGKWGCTKYRCIPKCEGH